MPLKIINQIWEAGAERFPYSDKMLSKTWQELHPSGQYGLWDRDRTEDFFYYYFPEMFDVFYYFCKKAFDYNEHIYF